MPTRPARGRLLGGVCAGLAERSRIDVALVRLAFLLLGLAWGIGVAVYAALWVVMPEGDGALPDGGLRGRARQNLRGMPGELRHTGARFGDAWRRAGQHPSALLEMVDRRTVALGLVAVGGVMFLAAIGALDWVTPVRVIGLLAVAGGLFILVAFRDQ